MTKAETIKFPARKEIVNLKVFIHCEGCKKQVKKVLQRLDGVDSITIDADIGKLTVTGTVDAGTLVKKLAKAGKHAEPWTNVPHAEGKLLQQTNYKKENNETKDQLKAMDFEGSYNEIGSGKNLKKKNNNNSSSSSSNNNNNHNNGNINNFGVESNYNMMNVEGGADLMLNRLKKGGKKVVTVGEMNSNDHNMATAAANWKKNVASRMNTVEVVGHSMESVEYAIHMFSDENANNCTIM